MTEQETNPQLFQDNSCELAAQHDAAAVARAIQEIQAALVIAQRFRRDEIKAEAKILQACQRKELAEVAEYEYSRGGTRITGPTIDLLRAIANRWGNIRFGWEEKYRQDGASSVRCFAWDLQTNGQAERTFTVKHWRDTQAGGYELTDERDIYELLANSAARRVRACLEEVIDSDIVTKAVDQCRRTLREGEKVPLKDRAVQMVTAYQEFGVTKEMIETKLGNTLESISENQIASLRRIFKSLKDGIGKREDYFKPIAAKPEFAGTGVPQSETAGQSFTGSSPEPQKPVPELAIGAGAGVTQQAKTTEMTAAPQPNAGNPAPAPQPLKALRHLCKAGKIPEGRLLEFLASEGITDGSHSSLEDLMLSAPNIITLIGQQWAQIVEGMKGGAK